MGGFAGADLAIAVSKAGGLGQIGAVFDMKELATNLEKVEQSLSSSDGVLPVGVGYAACSLTDIHSHANRAAFCPS